jgi:hypothetical protein
MGCEDRARLEKEHTEAGLAFDAARRVLQEKIGISPHEEFISLSRAVETTWEQVQRTRTALDEHIRAHNCHNP